MNDYWHIPRASLAASLTSSAVSSISSSNHSNKSYTNPPTIAQSLAEQLANSRTQTDSSTMSASKRQPLQSTGAKQNRQQQQQHYNNKTATPKTPRPSSGSTAVATNPAITAAAAAAVLAAAAVKRGSRSSQGSSDSNNSTRSAASGSLLLTAANLERFAEIQKKQNANQLKSTAQHELANVHYPQQQYNANLLHAAKLHEQQVPQQDFIYTIANQQQLIHANDGKTANSNDNGDAIITMDPNLNFIKTKDLDTVSIASSMHFTMVNGDVGQAKKPKRGLCDRGRQVTVLIVSMSTIFLLLIMGMVYALEMRAREMPQS